MERRKPRQLYYKMFYTYTAIVLFIVSVLVICFIIDARNRQLLAGREEIGRIHGQAVGYAEEIRRAADYIHKDLYRSPSELDDLLEYFCREPGDYQEYALDRYSSSGELVYKGIFRFVNEAFEANDRLEKIELISYETSLMTVCYGEKTVYPGKDARPKLLQIQNGETGEEGKLVCQKEIRDPDTMKPVGAMLLTFEAAAAFDEFLSVSAVAGMVVVKGDGGVIYEGPSGRDYASMIRQKQSYRLSDSVGEYQLYTFMNERQAAHLPAARFFVILAAGAAVSAVGIFNIRLYVKHLTGKVNRILDAMNQVTTGDFNVRLDSRKKEDELDMIADNFNGMCEKLEAYIEKSYLEEIARKDAQMQALQSQINPHFLYNTLEAIRMRAICNGDREVGKMLYSMVVLFRSQLKEANVITLGQELDYCKQYLELFEYRYQDCFRSEVECPPELLAVPVIKFMLQPVIENYFIHGIERDRKDNLVKIQAEREGDRLFLYVQDNGRGMEEEELLRRNRELRENKKINTENGSIGIHNVNRRIRWAYGEDCGIALEAAAPRGLRVILTIRTDGGDGYENGDAC